MKNGSAAERATSVRLGIPMCFLPPSRLTTQTFGAALVLCGYLLDLMFLLRAACIGWCVSLSLEEEDCHGRVNLDAREQLFKGENRDRYTKEGPLPL